MKSTPQRPPCKTELRNYGGSIAGVRRSGDAERRRDGVALHDADRELRARALDGVGRTVLRRINPRGDVIGRHVRRRCVDGNQFGLLACRGLVGAHQHLFQRHAVFEAQAHRVRRGLVGLEVGQAQVLASHELDVALAFARHATRSTDVDHSRCALLQFQHVGLGGVGSVGGRGQQCGCGHGREKRFLHGWTPIAPSQVRV